MKYHPNAPAKLKKLLRQNKENQNAVAKIIGVNSSHISKLVTKGEEPKDSSIRVKLFLSAHPICKCCGRKIVNRKKTVKKETPQYMKVWKHLSTDERNTVIQQYIKFKEAKVTITL